MTAIIHINRNVIQQNAKRDVPLPVIRVDDKTKFKETKYGWECVFFDKDGDIAGRMIYRPDEPLKCGAKLWIEWEGDYELLGETTYSEMTS